MKKSRRRYSGALYITRAFLTMVLTRLGGVLQYIGNVLEITEHKLEAICPIHLLIDGSPCNDLSAITRFSKDVYGVLCFHLCLLV